MTTTRVLQRAGGPSTADRHHPDHVSEEATVDAVEPQGRVTEDWKWHVHPIDAAPRTQGKPEPWYKRADDLIQRQAWSKLLGG